MAVFNNSLTKFLSFNTARESLSELAIVDRPLALSVVETRCLSVPGWEQYQNPDSAEAQPSSPRGRGVAEYYDKSSKKDLTK